MKLLNWLPRYPAIFLGSIASILIGSTGAIAAERVVLTWGPFSQSVYVSDLEAFIEDGSTTKTIRQMVSASGQDKDTLRGLLGLQIGFDRVAMARILYSNTGEQMLSGMGRTLRTRHRLENEKALRAAIILSLADDEQLSIIEILQKYPVSGLYVDLANVGDTVEKLQGLAGNLQELLR